MISIKRITNIYRPITATPFQRDETYFEILPCDALKPYIRCFWGSEKPLISENTKTQYGLVIPDTCMDVIFEINHTKNEYTDVFCALDDHSYKTLSLADDCKFLKSTFAIRFYAHTAILFSEHHFKNSKNKIFSSEDFFSKLKEEILQQLFEKTTIYERVVATENFLLKNLHIERINTDLMNSIFYIIKSNGSAKISDIISYSSISQRQLERIFDYNIGISPKTFSSLLRYQMLWRDMVLSEGFDILDAVDKYGYTDQSHLLKDFKSRHLMFPKNAIEFAKK